MAQLIKEELAEWRELKKWLMNPSKAKADIMMNEEIENAPASEIVRFIKLEHRRLIQELKEKEVIKSETIRKRNGNK